VSEPKSTTERDGRGDELNDSIYRELENRGRPHNTVSMRLALSVENLTEFFDDKNHLMLVSDQTSTITLRPPDKPKGPTETFPVRGTVELMVSSADGLNLQPVFRRYKPYGLRKDEQFEQEAIGVLEGMVKTTKRTFLPLQPREPVYTTRVDPRPIPDQRFMVYKLSFGREAQEGRWTLEGYKRLRDDAALNAWRDTTSLFVRVKNAVDGLVVSGGVVHVDLVGFLHQLNSVRVVTKDEHGRQTDVHPTLDDPARTAWAIGTFGAFFFGALQRIYLPQLSSLLSVFGSPPPTRPVSS